MPALSAPVKRRAWLLPLAAAGLLLGGAGLALLLRPAGPPSQPRQRFITFSGQDGAPAFSPDGKTLAFSSNRTGVARIWIKQYPKGEEAVLSEGPDSNPRFTPDGTQILFNRIAEGGRSDLYRISALGGDSRLLVQNAIGGELSPDGHRLAFLRGRSDPKGIAGTGILVAKPDGSEARELGWSSGSLRGKPRWSPDGRWIAVTSQPEGSYLVQPWRIELFSPEGGAPRQLNPPQRLGALSSIAWAADGKLVYTQSEGLYGGSAGSLILQDPKSGAAHPLLHSLAVGPEMDLSPEGDVVMEAWLPRSNLRLAGGLNGDGQWLTLGICADRQPAAASDGKRIAFSSNRDGNLDLWELRLDTGRLRRLTDDAAEDWDPCYSADGQRLYWSSNRTGHYEIWTARADGTEAKALTNLGWDAENPTPSPDGSAVTFGAYDTPHFGVWRMATGGGSPRQIYAGTVGAPPEPSPDGRTLAVSVPDADGISIRLLDGETGAEKGRISMGRIPAAARGVVTGRCRWTPDGKALVLVSADERDRVGIFRYAVGAAGSPSRQLMLNMQPGLDPESFAVMPDGQRLVVALHERATNLLRVTGLPLRPRRR
jgi:TolB protein